MAREDAEALRRRLYAPEASTDDVDRYRAAAPAEAPSPEPLPRVEEAPLSAPRRRSRIPLIATAIVLVAVAAMAVLLPRVLHPPVERTAPTTISSDASDRAAFLESLDLGNQAGIAAYLVTHTSPPDLADASRYFTVERAGIGSRRVQLGRVPADAIAGRATVLLVLGSDADAGWRALHREVDSSGEQQYVPQLTRGGPQSAGVLTGTTFRYRDGDRPVVLDVDAPAGVRWGVAVVFSD